MKGVTNMKTLVEYIVFSIVELFWKGVSKACSVVTNECLYVNNFGTASTWLNRETAYLNKAYDAHNRRKGLAL